MEAVRTTASITAFAKIEMIRFPALYAFDYNIRKTEFKSNISD